MRRSLHDFASTVQAGYRVADERFLATKGPLTWDAVRHHIGSRLGSAGYALAADDWSSDYMIVYSLYRHNGWLRSHFNDDIIMAAGLVKTAIRTTTGDEVYLYGYFRLVPN